MPSKQDFNQGSTATGPGDVAGVFGISPVLAASPVATTSGASIGGSRPLTDRPDFAQPPTTVAQTMQGFYAMSPAQLASLQGQLLAGGFYPASYYNPSNPRQPQLGTPDDDSFAAFKSLVTQTARSPGMTLEEVLGRAMDSNNGLPGSQTRPIIGGATDTHVVQVTNPTDLEAVLKKTFQDVLGRKARKGEIDKFTQRYQQNERDFYQTQFAAQDKAAQAYRSAQEQSAGLGPGGVPIAAGGGDVASTIVSVGKQMGASDKVILAAVEAGIVESGLQNLNHGDRDSLGVFQQRPSQGWGTPAQVMDPTYAATQFFRRAIPADKPNLSPGQLAQAVQRSAYPARYDQVEGHARAVLAGVTPTAAPAAAAPTAPQQPGAIELPISQTVEVTNPASAANAAEAEARATNPEEAQTHDLFTVYNQALAFVSGGKGLNVA